MDAWKVPGKKTDELQPLTQETREGLSRFRRVFECNLNCI